MKIIIFLLFIISINTFSQNTIVTKDIANVALPNPEVELFYGNVNYSADNIVILPKYVIIYSPEKASFHLLDKKNKLNLDQKSLFDINNIVTKRIRFGEDVNGKFRTIVSYKTPFVNFTILNEIEMYSISDTSVFGGIIRVKKNYKIIKLFVKNDSLRIDLLDYNPKKSFKNITKQEKRNKIKLDKKKSVDFVDYVEFGDKQIFSFSSSPYIFKKPIITRERGTRYYRDSILNFNALYYKTNDKDSFNLLYQNSYKEISKVYKKPRHGFGITPSMFVLKDRLVLWLNMSLDSIIVFDKNFRRVFTSNLKSELKKFFPDKIRDKESFWLNIYKDEFTEKLYISFESEKGTAISEVSFNERTQKVNLHFLREYSQSGAAIYPIAINKGVLYLGSKNNIIGNKYIYCYDLYKGLDRKNQLLEIKFGDVNSQTKGDNHNSYLIKYENYQPLSKKFRKKYFKKIKQDTSVFNQSTYLDVLKSIKKAINLDSVQYALSYLFVYSALDRLEIKDDIKARNYLYFDLLTEFYYKEKALSQINYFIDDFDSFDKQMYKNKMIVRTPDGFVFEIYQFNDLWFLSPVIKKITYEIDE